MSIFLLIRIGRDHLIVIISLLECLTPGLHLENILFRKLHVREHFLQSCQHDVIFLNSFLLIVVRRLNTEQVISEGRDHEQLLQNAIHVARVPQIFEAKELLVLIGLEVRLYAPG